MENRASKNENQPLGQSKRIRIKKSDAKTISRISRETGLHHPSIIRMAISAGLPEVKKHLANLAAA